MYEYSKSELDSIIVFLDSELIIDSIYIDSIKSAIKKTMNQSYKDETIEKKVRSTQSLRDSLYLLDKHINNYMGIVFERIEMFNYNYLENPDGLITITNPDPTSKSDLLHIKDDGNYSFINCGPDVKFGSPDYVVDEYIKKHLMNSESNGFVGISGYLKSEDYCEKNGFKTLSKNQNAKILKAIQEYGYKPAIPSRITRMQFHRIFYYYLNYLTTGKLPSEVEMADLSILISRVNKNTITESEIRQRICVEQYTLTVSELAKLKNGINNSITEDHTVYVKPDTIIENNDKLPSVGLNSKEIFKNKNSILNSDNPNIRRVLKGFKYATIGLVAAAGAAIAITNPSVRKQLKKLFRPSQKMLRVEKPVESLSKSNINVDMISDNAARLATNEKAACIIADSKSVFRPLLDMFSENQLSKAEFYEQGQIIANEEKKSLIKYLEFMKNVHNNDSAAKLLKQ